MLRGPKRGLGGLTFSSVTTDPAGSPEQNFRGRSACKKQDRTLFIRFKTVESDMFKKYSYLRGKFGRERKIFFLVY